MTTHLSSRSLRFSAFQLFSLVLILFASISLFAQSGATFYVSTSGSDSNPGTYSQPWLTMQHAANTATAGATVYVMGGVYNAYVSFPNSGTAGEPITFLSYPVLNGTTLQGAVIDGTGLTVSGTQCLITISGARSYITVSGFEIRNLSSSKGLPCGILFTGSGTGVQILNNLVHNINMSATGNGGGILVYGTSTTPITQLVVSGNELYALQTGTTESLTVAGNVTHFQIANNLIHDNDNIGIDVAGYWKHGPTGYDQPMYGVVSGNTIYNISGVGSASQGNEYDADGIYCDGCAYITFERNVIFQVDYGIETTSENQKCQANGTEWSGPNNTGTAATSTYPCYGMYATVRNNLFYGENACGNSIGGYALASSKANSNGGGGSFHDVFVNNTLYDNGAQPGNSDEGTPSGDFQTQYQVGSAQNNYFENTIIYESADEYTTSLPLTPSPNMWINSYVPGSQVYPQGLTYPPPAATLNWNLYGSALGYAEGTSILWSDVSSYTSFANYQSTNIGGGDANSLNADPLFDYLEASPSTPPNFTTDNASPAVGGGSTSLSCSVGWCDPNGSSPNSIYGNTDILGNPRTNPSTGAIDIGAYQNNGAAIPNSMTVSLNSGASQLQGGQTTTLGVTVTAIPGGGGAPTGTVSIYNGQTLLETATLTPTGINTTAVTLPLSASQLTANSANNLTAVYSGNSVAPCCNPSYPPGGSQTQIAWYPSATSTSITVTEQPTQPNTVTFTTPAPASAEYGSNFTVAASGLGTGAITYTSDGVVCTNSGATYTMISGTGTCTVTATQAADTNYESASASENVTAEPAVGSVSVTLTSGSNPSNYGDSITFTATVTSDTGAVKGRRTTKRPRDLNGSVSWSGNTGCSASSVSGNPPQTATCTTSILGGGTDTVTATYTANDSNHTTGSGSINQSVNPVSQTITVSTSAPSTAIDNSSFTIVASASSGLPVSFASSGSCTNSGGTYTITAGSRAGSICYETVSQAGNNNYTAANAVTEDTTVAGQTTPTVSFTGPSPSKAVYGTTFQVTASSVNDTSVPVITTSTGTACQIAGSTTNGTTVTATIQMLTGNESCKLAANWAVNTVFKADSKSLTVTAEKVTPTVSFTGAPATANNGGTFTVTAASNSSATPSITSASPAVCSIGSFGGNGPGSYQATVTMLKATGTCKLKAVWPINADYTNASAVQSTTAE